MEGLTFSRAVDALLTERQIPVLSDFTLAFAVAQLLINRSYKGQRLRIRQGEVNQPALLRRIKSLEKENVITLDDDFVRRRLFVKKIRFGANVWHPTSNPRGTAEDVACLVDPCSHVAYLSAMQRFGLTDRAPKNLMLRTYSRERWNEERDKVLLSKMKGEYHQVGLKIRKITLPPSIRGRDIEVHEVGDAKSTTEIIDTFVRVASIGETFLDMLYRPDLCGGMAHVLEIWERNATTHLESIIAKVDQCSTNLVKVRAGYILDELLGIQNPRIESWISCAARGGDQKLDPQRPYKFDHSEKWMLSLNA